MRRKTTDLLHGTIWKQLLIFFFPVFFGSLFQQLYNTVDAIVVGNFIGKEALGAVGGSTGTVINLLIGFVTGLSGGASVVIAQYYGANERENVRKGIGTGMALALVLGVLLMAVGLISSPYVLKLLDVPDTIYPYSLAYMRVYYLGMIPTMIYNNGSGILRAVGDSKRPFYFLVTASIINIVLDLLFVGVFGFGIIGAAAATVISQAVSCILILISLKTSDDIYAFDIRHITVDKDILKEIIRIGIPSGLQSVCYSLSNLFVQAGINGHGTDTVAAYTAYNKVDAVFWYVSAALSMSVLTFVGQNFGAGNMERVKKGVRTGLVMYMAIAIGCSVLMYTACPVLIGLFSKDEEVIRIGVQITRYLVPFYATYTFVSILSSTIRACGDTLVPMIMTAFGTAVLRIIWILMTKGGSIFTTLTCYPLSWSLTSVLFMIYYYSGAWKKRMRKS